MRDFLALIPLPLRVAFYCLFFLAVVLIGLPWLALQFDERFPAWRVELGPLRALGWLIFALALGAYLAASFVLTSRGRGAYVEFDPPTEFVAGGPFLWCRNPIAACVVLMLLGLAIGLSSTGVFLLFLVSLPLAHAQVVLLEEPLLRARFGQAYEEYLRSTPRWLPRPRRRARS